MNRHHASQKSVAPRAIATQIAAISAVGLAIVIVSFAIGLSMLTVVGPVLVAAGLWLIVQGLKDRADHRAVARAIRLEQPRQGQWTAVSGKAVSLGRKPADPRDILAFRYQIFDVTRGKSKSGRTGSKSLVPRYDGYFLAPTGIKSRFGTVQLFGFPDLIHLDKKGLPNDVLVRSKEKAELKPEFLPGFAARMLVSTQIRDRFDAAIKYSNEESTSEGTSKFWQLRPDEEVCVFGVWKNRALFPSSNRPRGLPVYAGTAEEVHQRLKEDSSAFMIIGAFIILLVAAWALWTLI